MSEDEKKNQSRLKRSSFIEKISKRMNEKKENDENNENNEEEEEIYIVKKGNLNPNKEICDYIKEKDYRIFNRTNEKFTKIDFSYMKYHKINPNTLNVSQLRSVYNRKYENLHKERLTKHTSQLNKKLIDYKNILKHDAFNKFSESEIGKHRSLLSKTLFMNVDHLNEIYESPNKNKTYIVETGKEEGNSADVLKRVKNNKKLLEYYNLPRLKEPEAPNRTILYKENNQSTRRKEEEVVDLSSKSNIEGRLNESVSKRSLNINKFLYSKINHMSKSIKAKRLLKTINEIDSIDKTLKKFKKTKVFDLSEAVNFIDNTSQNQHSSLVNKVKPDDYFIGYKSFGSLENRSNFFRNNIIYLPCKIITFVNKPCVRIYSSLSLKNQKMYLFGGNSTKKLNDLWEFDFSKSKKNWEMVFPKGSIPEPRFGHTSIVFNNEIIIYGGVIGAQTQTQTQTTTLVNYTEFIIIYDIKKNYFLSEKTSNSEISTWRSYHVAEQAGIFMIVHGGISRENHYLNDVILLDLKALKWYMIKDQNRRESVGVAFHSSTLVVPSVIKNNPSFHIYSFPDEYENLNKRLKIKHAGLYVFGGLEYNYNTSQFNYSNELKVLLFGTKPLTWKYLSNNGSPPENRASSSLNYYEELSILVVYGGYSKSKVYNDLYLFDLVFLQWSRVEIIGDMLPKRQGHSSEINNNQLFIFGGAGIRSFEGSDIICVDLDVFSHSVLVSNNKIEEVSGLEKKNKLNDENALSHYEFVKSLSRRVINNISVDIKKELLLYEKEKMRQFINSQRRKGLSNINPIETNEKESSKEDCS